MRIFKSISVIIFLFFSSSLKSQTCQASFVYSLSPNGNVTFSNTSILNATTNPVFVWDFGNNTTFTTTSLSQTVGTTYTSTGMYYTSLNATVNSIGCNMNLSNVSYTVPGCNLFANDSAVGNQAIVNFINNTTGTLSNTSYTWSFGDGSTSNAINPIHTYTANGLYSFTLYASNNATCNSHYITDLLHASNLGATQICAYTNTITPSFGANGLVNFTVSPVYPPVVSNNVWTFTSSPNGYCLGFGANVSSYFLNGTYTVTNQVLTYGCTRNNSIAITVTNNPGTSSTAFTNSIVSPGIVQFSLTSPATNTNILFEWDFGDGITSNLANPLHTYNNAGIYTINVTDHINSTTGCSYMGYTQQTINVTGIPCTPISNFTIQPNAAVPHQYYLIPSFPYNVSAATWSWGDGSSCNYILCSGHTYSASGTYSICLSVTTSCGSSSVSCINQFLAKGVETTGDMISVVVKAPDKISGLNQNLIENPSSLEIFPNPNSGLLNINFNKQFKAQEIEIFNLIGGVVYQNKINSDEEKIQLDLRHLNNGIYFLKLNSNNNSVTSKFIISK